jgi:xylulokinase
VTVVGLDIGTSAVKGLAIDGGEVVAKAEAGYPLLTPRPGWSEQDPDQWWRAAQQVLDELPAPTAIGLSGQMHGLVVVDREDGPLAPAILWNDQRTGAECAEIEELVSFEQLGNPVLTGFTAPKLRWLAKHEPELYARIDKVMLPKDYVRLKLTGEHATDVADASGTLWLDVGARQWNQPVLEALDVDPAWLPRVLESPEVSGETPDGVPVHAGAGDQAAGALGVGADRADGPLSIVLGTSGVVFAAQDGFHPDPRLHAFCHALPGAWHQMGVMLSAAGSLSWLQAVLDAPYEELLAGAAQWEPGAEGLTFLPYLAGERTPHADPDARGSFTGLGLRHDRGALTRAVLEGVAFGLRDALDLMEGAPAVARVSGGGARSDLWLEIIASVLELTLERVAVDEGAAYGAALLAGADAPPAVTATIEPNPAWVEPYREARERFVALYPALRGLQDGRGRVRSVIHP